ncbi:hypothetical protein [Frondihabitans cladoniiphilus]|uniref:HutD protein n=1 Tax=Frondihabitans cladoniiphilus TaxID=715785 RepID=A0ABP8WAT7_9MICO
MTGIDARVPMVRLDRLQSAIGSLVVTGASSVAWESVTGLTGAASDESSAEGSHSGSHVGAVVPTSGNRPLVGFDEGAVLVALRHVGELRRGLVVGRGAGVLGVRLLDGVTLTVSAWGEGDVPALSLLVVDGLLELRAERVAAATTDPEVHREFGFAMTPQFDFPERRP